MTRDPWDDLSSSLFAAGRREAPNAAAKRRTLQRALARAEQPRARPIAPWAVAALAAALLGAVWLLPEPEAPHAPISAEQPRARERVAKAERAEIAENAEAAERAPEPHAAASEPQAPAFEALAPVADRSSAPAPLERSGDAGPARRQSEAEAPREPASKPAVASRPPPSSPPPSPSPPTLEAELAVLDRAREELGAGQVDAALASLDRYDALRGVHLALEARVLRIQALAARGERARAAALARELVAEHPDSPLAERARRFTTLDSAPNPTPPRGEP